VEGVQLRRGLTEAHPNATSGPAPWPLIWGSQRLLRLGSPVSECIVALTGFGPQLSSIARGLLERYGLSLVECANAEAAVRLLRESLRVDAVALNARHEAGRRGSEAVRTLIALSCELPWRDEPLPLIVWAGRLRLPTPAPAHLIRVSAPRQSYRELARLVREACGLPAIGRISAPF
jgi:hypothetical protein